MGRRAKMMIAKAEKKQQREDAGILSDLFPKVRKISISMMYNQTGVLEPLSRTVNFFPGSYAIFRLNCLCSECGEGGFEFSRTITGMVKSHKTASKGKTDCDHCASPECSDVAYDIKIEYAASKRSG
jgi:hypothetical protein